MILRRCGGINLPSLVLTTPGCLTSSSTAHGPLSRTAKTYPMTSRSLSFTPFGRFLPLLHQSSRTACPSLGWSSGSNYEAHLSCRSKKIQAQIHKIYVKLFKTFEKTSPTAAEVDRALEAMRLIAPLSEEDIAIKSYSLFRILMKAPVSPAYTQEKKWEAYRLALHGAYKWDNFLPLVEDPRDILTFLSHHFELADRGEDQGEPIQNALRALAYALNPQTIDTFKNFDPTQPSFIRGICFAFQAGQPRELRKAALFFLPLVADRLFNTSAPIMTTDEMKTLCENWASAVDEIGHSAYLVQKVALAVLLDMMNSPHWRPHIVPKEWKLLERFTSAVPDDSEPLKRCLDNTELLGAISNMGNPDAMSLWSLVLWLRYAELKPEVQVQLKEVTKGVQKWDFERYLEAIEMEASKAENELTEYNPWTTDPGAGVLKTKIDNLRVAKESLMALKSGGR
ncbi:hypothetical protein BJ322DRAFT_823820 [Thelephora terrestris]|uniref:Uncharacterized protein n=1 Tax=Thelephora terrestris TaxID=56493 RepID=A0A9P6HE75_9AGAM|nr:hypothetical protein BJ322DRAFT_823820 [Thelephora terrestris]